MEEWKDIVGFEGYEVSNLGRVRSLNRIVNKKHCPRIQYGRMLKAFFDERGYPCICLCKDGKGKFFKIHRLVAVAFIPNPNNYPTVNHKHGIKTDNRVSELEWMSFSDQMFHAYSTGLNRKIFGNNERIKAARLKANAARRIKLNIFKDNKLFGISGSVLEAASITNMSKQCVSRALNTGRQSHGFFFYRIDETKSA